jgi:hypothetical protein
MKIDQALFGYDEGHRLLVSSLQLGSETSLLTELSDLAPGTIFNGTEGYWTGLPIPALKRYALLRTWPAPEMSRPGCVWTHALFLKTETLESLTDLSLLQQLIHRPTTASDRELYRQPIEVEVRALQKNTAKVPPLMVTRLLSMLYATGDTSVKVSSPGDIDDPLFAVWTQQWPRLRRNLRFQTATSRSPRSVGSTRFDVTAVLSGQENLSSLYQLDVPWLTAAQADVYEGEAGSLRHFLRKYGADVKRQRNSFRPLVEIRLLDLSAPIDAGDRLISILKQSFAAADDAMTLKQDLVDGVLIAPAQAELLRYVFSDEGSMLLPAPNLSRLANLDSLWPDHSQLLLELAEQSVLTAKPIGQAIIDKIILGSEAALLWMLERASQEVCMHIIKKRPKLLMMAKIERLEVPVVAQLLELAPNDVCWTDELITKLFDQVDPSLIAVIFDKFGEKAAIQLISEINNGSRHISDKWLQELLLRPSMLLKSQVIGRVSDANLLWVFAESFGGLTPVVMAAGAGPWAAALKRIPTNQLYEAGEKLYSFLVILALRTGGDGGLTIIEKCFDPLHSKILRASLDRRVIELLSSVLPEAGWLRGWDLGLRFRLAVAAAYVRYRWPTSSFANLVSDRKVRSMLSDAAADTEGGEPYAQATSRHS